MYPLPKVCNPRLLVLASQAKIALVTGHNDSCDQEHGVSAGVHSSVEFYKSRVDRFMCHGSSHTTKGFPSTFGLFRADNEAKLKEQKSSAFKMEEVHFLNFFALLPLVLY